ncbi:MAG: hypothetical protein EOO47_10650 [Flavobacterium sp.]|nr:MAG: hypothetical protein EOO47_10650 [Flavobacterium sp.]
MKIKLAYIIPFFIIAFFSCEEVLLEDDISKEEVRLIAPVDEAQFFSTGITFTWDPIDNGIQYRIQIAKPNFANAMQIIADNVIDTTSFTTQLNLGEYEWRVQAVNSGYSTIFTARSFTVVSNEDFQSNSITLSSPADNTITNNSTQALKWQPVIGATSYRVQIVNIANNNIVNEQDITGTTLNYTFPEGSYQWKVRGANGEQNTLYSTRSILIDGTAPNTPALVTPANLSNTSSNDVTFKWTRTPIAGSIEKDSIYIYNNSTLTDLEYSNEEVSPYNTITLQDGTYFWFVRSFDNAGNIGQQSPVYSFTLN